MRRVRNLRELYQIREAHLHAHCFRSRLVRGALRCSNVAGEPTKGVLRVICSSWHTMELVRNM